MTEWLIESALCGVLANQTATNFADPQRHDQAELTWVTGMISPPQIAIHLNTNWSWCWPTSFMSDFWFAHKVFLCREFWTTSGYAKLQQPNIQYGTWHIPLNCPGLFKQLSCQKVLITKHDLPCLPQPNFVEQIVGKNTDIQFIIEITSPLQEITCHMGSRCVTCHPAEVTSRLYPSHSWYSIGDPRGMQGWVDLGGGYIPR